MKKKKKKMMMMPLLLVEIDYDCADDTIAHAAAVDDKGYAAADDDYDNDE